MANKRLFQTKTSRVAPATTTNKAGGRAYKASDSHSLCQYVATGCFGSTYYIGAGEQLAKVKELVRSVDPVLVAKAAVYGHEKGRMKDVPAYLVAALAAQGRMDLVERIFPRVITTAKMLTTFVQIVRSGQTGRKSFGTALKRLVQNWFNSRHTSKIFAGSIGQAQPSFADIIKMVHPRPTSDFHQAMYAYLLGKEYNPESLPENVRQFELFKRGETKEVPDVPFRALTNVKMGVAQWRSIARDMPWNTLRMNLNMLQRKGVFAGNGGDSFARAVAHKLADEEAIRSANALPYSLLTAYQNTKDVPTVVQNALQDALEVATGNVPKFDHQVALCIDTSGSMSSPITGYRGRGATTVTRCVDVAGLIAACFIRNNDDAIILPFDTSVHHVHINPRDSVMTNARKLARGGGGTDCSCATAYLNQTKARAKTVIYVSDCESWADYHGIRTYWYNRGTGLANEWETYKRRVKGAKLVLIDLVAPDGLQVPDAPNVLNVGGFSDAVFDVVGRFVEVGDAHFVDVVNETEI